MKNIILLILTLFSINLFASDPSSYKQAYEMESLSTLFAIPLYEHTLHSNNPKNLQKAAVSRLFYLYKKHNKIIEALLIGTRFSHIISSKEKAGIWKTLTEIYKPVSYEHLTSSYVLAVKANPENYSEILKYLQDRREPKLFEFVYIVLFKRKQYETLNKIFESDQTLTSSPLYEGLVTIKVNPERGKEYLSNVSTEGEKDNATKSDLLYLLGQYFRAIGENKISARYFRMSGTFLWPERAKIESSKSLVLSGNFSEACQNFSFSSSPNEEVAQIFYLVCEKKDKRFLKDIRASLKALGSKEGGEFFQKVNQSLEKWDS
jgi:hypothetical protein